MKYYIVKDRIKNLVSLIQPHIDCIKDYGTYDDLTELEYMQLKRHLSEIIKGATFIYDDIFE